MHEVSTKLGTCNDFQGSTLCWIPFIPPDFDASLGGVKDYNLAISKVYVLDEILGWKLENMLPIFFLLGVGSGNFHEPKCNFRGNYLKNYLKTILKMEIAF